MTADNQEVSVEDVLARVRQIQALPSAAPPTVPAPAAPDAEFDALVAGLATLAPLDAGSSDAAAGLGFGSPSASALLGALQQLRQAPPSPLVSPATSGAGGRLLAAAETQLGQGEQPPGSNDGPAIAAYRAAVPGSQPGDPWCAEFVSWSAAQAGAPLGDTGGGFRSVAALTDWAARTGRLLPAGSTPQPGDLILFGDRHVGIVQSVEPNGTIDTVEGNYGSAVSRVRRAPSEATGFVRP